MLVSNLLPGLRDLRAPLAAGYLWLLAAWLLIAKGVDAQRSQSRVVIAIRKLDLAEQPLVKVAAVTVMAYLVGTVISELSSAARRYLRARRAVDTAVPPIGTWKARAGRQTEFRVVPPPQVDVHPLSRRGRRVIDDLVAKELRALSSFGQQERTDIAQSVFGGREPVEEVKRELGEVSSRLQERKSALFDQVDRLRAEAEFRYAVAAPLFAVALIVLSDLRPPVATTVGLLPLAALPAVVLFVLGDRAERSSNDALADALLAEIVRAPCFERVDALLRGPEPTTEARGPRDGSVGSP